jgi:acyl-CoA synthetase (NDP forming)
MLPRNCIPRNPQSPELKIMQANFNHQIEYEGDPINLNEALEVRKLNRLLRRSSFEITVDFLDD